MKSGFNILLIIFLVCILGDVWAQQPAPAEISAPADTTSRQRETDTLKQKFYPRAIRFGTDILALVKSAVVSGYGAYELNADVDFGKYYLAVDRGRVQRDYTISNGGDYHMNGTYWRVGWDANLLKQDPDRNMIFLGIRYGWASFQETMSIAVKDQVFGDHTKDLVNPNVRAAWAELTGGLRIRMWNQIWMGYTARFKFAPSVKGSDAFETYEIPGYGLRAESLYWGFNYQVFYKIPFKRQK